MNTTKEIILLSAIENGKQIYETHEARFYSRFKSEHPNHIVIEYNDSNNPADPYFKATLTGSGRGYLRSLETVGV